MPVSAPLPTPTHNAGAQAQASLFAAQGLDALKKASALVDPASPLGQAIFHALKAIGKQVGNTPPETQVNSLNSQLVEARRNAMQRLALQQMQMNGGGGQQPQPGAAPAPGQSPAPMAA